MSRNEGRVPVLLGHQKFGCGRHTEIRNCVHQDGCPQKRAQWVLRIARYGLAGARRRRHKQVESAVDTAEEKPEPLSLVIQIRGPHRSGGTPMSIRTVIVDDEPLAREWIRNQLPGEEGFEVVAECDDGFKAVSTIERMKPDLLILDIQMPGLDGFGVLRMLEGTVPPAIIFVTAFDRYAVAAFEVHAIDYLLKPVSPERLSEALERSKSVLQRKASQESAAQLLGLLKDMRHYPDWLLIKT